MRTVRLLVQHGTCMPGDVAGFPDEIADRLLARGLADPVERQPVTAIAAMPAPPAAAVVVSPAAGRARPRRP